MSLYSRYDWPNHLWAVLTRVMDAIAITSWTAWTRLDFYLHGVSSIGKGFSAVGRIHVLCRRRNSIVIGRNVCLVSRFESNLVGLTNPIVLDTRYGGQITIGDFSGLSGVVLSSKSKIEIGKHVKVGGNVRIFDHDFHARNYESRRDGQRDRAECLTTPIIIDDDVFVGTNAIILKGTRIGARSIIGAGAVLAGLNVPPDSLVVGNPAKIVKQLAE